MSKRFLHSRQIIDFIRDLYGEPTQPIPLHEPRFLGREKEYVSEAIDSTYVSSVGEYVNRFEKMICNLTGAKYAVATVNGTCALHASLILAGVNSGDEVITQPVTFVATVNAIAYCGAKPVFLDVNEDTLGLDAEALDRFLNRHTRIADDGCWNKHTGKRIVACVPVHTFGHPCQIDAIVNLCSRYGIVVVEDSTESLGSTYRGGHTGTFGMMGVFSFNGNKTITCGGGGMIVTDDEKIAKQAKHITTTAKIPHPYEYQHDEIGYNYRMPNLNAALACAQLENLDFFIEKKRELSKIYQGFFESIGIPFITEPHDARSNYWLNAIILPNRKTKQEFLDITNSSGIMTRPIWKLMNTLPMYKDCWDDGLKKAVWLEDRIVNIPSSVII